jgi:DNA replication protein DnaC
MGFLDSDPILKAFVLAGGPFVDPANDNGLRELRAQNPERFDAIRAEFQRRSMLVEAEEREAEIVAAERAVRAGTEAKRKRLQASGARLTDAMTTALVSNSLRLTEPLRAAQEWFSTRPCPWLVLSGGTGTGKTVAAAALVIANHSAHWVRSDDLVRTFAGFFGDAAERQKQLKSSPFLVIEDLGVELDAARMLPALLEVLDDRLSASTTPTVITTNLKKQQIAERYPNERLFSRLREHAHWVSLTNEDMRGKAAKL